MQQAGQAPYLDQNDAHEQSLGQSDGPLPGPEQTLTQKKKITLSAGQQFLIAGRSQDAAGIGSTDGLDPTLRLCTSQLPV